MPIPVIAVVGALGAGLLVWALSNDKSGKPEAGAGGAGPAPGDGGLSEWWQVAPNGVIVIRPDKQPIMFQVLSQKFLSPAQGGGDLPPGAMTVHEVNTQGVPALAWVSGQAAAGKHVLCSLDPMRPMLAAVAPGTELQFASAARKQWGMIAEGQAQAIPQTMPGAPGAVSPGALPGTINVPGFGQVPIPQGLPFPGSPQPAPMPGAPAPQGGPQTIPAGTQPGATPPQVIDVPGFGQVPIPPGFPFPAPQPPPAGPPAPPQPPPGAPPGAPPGTINVPGVGNIPIPPGVQLPGQPGQAIPLPGQGAGQQGAWPATHLFTIRPGDIASKMAEWYTGNFQRAYDLPPLNGLTIVGTGSKTQFKPWKAGQVLKLPLDWNVSKGLPPVQTKALKGSVLDIAKAQAHNALIDAAAQKHAAAAKAVSAGDDEETEAAEATLRALAKKGRRK